MFSMFQLLFQGRFLEFFIQLLVKAYVLLCVLPVHEFAHAYAAVKLGDDTPRLQGRLSLNPARHLDLWGSLLILFTGFGYARPVSINIRNFKNRKRDFAITAAAGPISNLIMALLYFLLSNLFSCFKFAPLGILVSFFQYVGIINVNLAVFNLLPIPPLDGSRLITVFVPDRYYYKLLQYERYIIIVIFLLLLTGALTVPLNFLSGKVANLLNFIARLPFRAFL